MTDNEDELKVSYDVGEIISSIIRERKIELNANRTEIGQARINFNSRNLSEEHPEIPADIARRCKHCGLQFKEHEELARHLAKRHPKEARAEYRREIEDKYAHPEGWEVRSPDEYGRYYCPFCATFFHSSPQRHASQHSALMEFVREATTV